MALNYGLAFIAVMLTCHTLSKDALASSDVEKKSAMEVPPSSLSAFEKINLEQALEYCLEHSNSMNRTFDGSNAVVVKQVGFGVTGANKVKIGLNMNKHLENGTIEFRIDGVRGQLLLSVPLNFTKDSNSTVVSGPVLPIKGVHDLYIIFSDSIRPNNVTWFQFEDSGPNPLEYYIIMSRMHSKAITVQGAAKEDNIFVRLFPFSYDTNQMFRFEKTTFSSYKVIARHSDKVMEVSKGAFTESAHISQTTYNGSQHQEWYMDSAGEGTIKIISRLTGRCMTVQNSSPNDNIFLVQNGCLNLTSQRWYLIPIC